MLDEKKTIALSAVTAAAVAAVTIVVYEGVVKADGKAVEPGTTYQIKKDGPTVIEEQMTVGASPELAARVSDLEAQLAAKQAELDALARTVDPFEPESFDRKIIPRLMRGLQGRIKDCRKGYDGKLVATVQVNPDGSVEKVTLSDGASSEVGACVADVIKTARFGASKSGGKFEYTAPSADLIADDFAPNPFTTPKPKCDALKLLQKGQDLYSAARPGEALTMFEQSYACDPKPQTLKYALAASCKSKNLHKARGYWRKMNEQGRNALLALCASYGFTRQDLDAKVDALE